MTLSESPLSALCQDASCTHGQIWTGAKPGVSLSEAGLIQRILGGENEASGDLVRPYEGAVFMTACAILHSDGDAEDAARKPSYGPFRISSRSAVMPSSALGSSELPPTRFS